MTATQKNYELRRTLDARTNAVISMEDAQTLRRAELTLHRWYELECGDSNNYGSWAIERDDNGDGPPFMVHHHYTHGRGKDYTSRTRIPDRENGAKRRVESLCKRLGLYWYYQTDPRGCALYVSSEPLDEQNYSSRGVAIQ